jgi:hypothetical protein
MHSQTNSLLRHRSAHAWTRPYAARHSAAVALGTLASILGGCVANSSNPTIAIRSATMDDAGADFELSVGNPGGRHLLVRRIEYEVSHGESSLPVAHGVWTGELDLPPRGDATLTLITLFDTPPIEEHSTALELDASLFLIDRTGFLGLRSMDLTSTPFRGTISALRRGDA